MAEKRAHLEYDDEKESNSTDGKPKFSNGRSVSSSSLYEGNIESEASAKLGFLNKRFKQFVEDELKQKPIVDLRPSFEIYQDNILRIYQDLNIKLPEVKHFIQRNRTLEGELPRNYIQKAKSKWKKSETPVTTFDNKIFSFADLPNFSSSQTTFGNVNAFRQQLGTNFRTETRKFGSLGTTNNNEEKPVEINQYTFGEATIKLERFADGRTKSQIVQKSNETKEKPSNKPEFKVLSNHIPNFKDNKGIKATTFDLNTNSNFKPSNLFNFNNTTSSSSNVFKQLPNFETSKNSPFNKEFNAKIDDMSSSLSNLKICDDQAPSFGFKQIHQHPERSSITKANLKGNYLIFPRRFPLSIPDDTDELKLSEQAKNITFGNFYPNNGFEISNEVNGVEDESNDPINILSEGSITRKTFSGLDSSISTPSIDEDMKEQNDGAKSLQFSQSIKFNDPDYANIKIGNASDDVLSKMIEQAVKDESGPALFYINDEKNDNHFNKISSNLSFADDKDLNPKNAKEFNFSKKFTDHSSLRGKDKPFSVFKNFGTQAGSFLRSEITMGLSSSKAFTKTLFGKKKEDAAASNLTYDSLFSTTNRPSGRREETEEVDLKNQGSRKSRRAFSDKKDFDDIDD